EILCVLLVQFQITGLAKIGERIFKEFGAVDIDNLIRGALGMNIGDFFYEGRKRFIAVWVIVMPRDLSHKHCVPGHVITDSRVREHDVLGWLLIEGSGGRNECKHSGQSDEKNGLQPLHISPMSRSLQRLFGAQVLIFGASVSSGFPAVAICARIIWRPSAR